jgi:hypothetical protein
LCVVGEDIRKLCVVGEDIRRLCVVGEDIRRLCVVGEDIRRRRIRKLEFKSKSEVKRLRIYSLDEGAVVCMKTEQLFQWASL